MAVIKTKNMAQGLGAANYDGYIEYNEVTGVLSLVETEVLNYTNSLGYPIYLQALGGTGSARSEWFFYINGILKVKRRGTTTDPNTEVPLHSFKLINTGTIIIKVKHYELTPQEYSADMRFEK